MAALDQPVRKRMYHYIREAKSFLSYFTYFVHDQIFWHFSEIRFVAQVRFIWHSVKNKFLAKNTPSQFYKKSSAHIAFVAFKGKVEQSSKKYIKVTMEPENNKTTV